MRIVKIVNLLLIIITMSFLISCKCNRKITETEAQSSLPEAPVKMKDETIYKGNAKDLQHIIIYRTKLDYWDKVPITLSADRKTVLSYPAPTDVYYNGKLAYPTKLADGYLLDNRGINEQVAFTSYTYEEYSKLEKAPSVEELLNSVVDSDPLVEIIDLGSRANIKGNEIEAINAIIKNNLDSYR